MKDNEIQFLSKLKENLKGYHCGNHLRLKKMIDNRIKDVERGG